MRVRPRRPAFSALRYLYTSFVWSPFTSDLAMSGNVTPWFLTQNSAISLSVPGSCPPNYAGPASARGWGGGQKLEEGRGRTWLQGKPRITKPWSLYFWYSFSRPMRHNAGQLSCLRAHGVPDVTCVLWREPAAEGT